MRLPVKIEVGSSVKLRNFSLVTVSGFFVFMESTTSSASRFRVKTARSHRTEIEPVIFVLWNLYCCYFFFPSQFCRSSVCRDRATLDNKWYTYEVVLSRSRLLSHNEKKNFKWSVPGKLFKETLRNTSKAILLPRVLFDGELIPFLLNHRWQK